MTPAEQHLLDYLCQQFSATVGHIPLKEKMRAIRNEALKDAAKVCADYDGKGLDPIGYDAQLGDAQRIRSEIEQQILTLITKC